jgi:hypothetical protein
VLFIGTQFSNLYTAVDTTARGRVHFFFPGACTVSSCDIDTLLAKSRCYQVGNALGTVWGTCSGSVVDSRGGGTFATPI